MVFSFDKFWIPAAGLGEVWADPGWQAMVIDIKRIFGKWKVIFMFFPFGVMFIDRSARLTTGNADGTRILPRENTFAAKHCPFALSDIPFATNRGCLGCLRAMAYIERILSHRISAVGQWPLTAVTTGGGIRSKTCFTVSNATGASAPDSKNSPSCYLPWFNLRRSSIGSLIDFANIPCKRSGTPTKRVNSGSFNHSGPRASANARHGFSSGRVGLLPQGLRPGIGRATSLGSSARRQPNRRPSRYR